jgi:hypothetical protein
MKGRGASQDIEVDVSLIFEAMSCGPVMHECQRKVSSGLGTGSRGKVI